MESLPRDPYERQLLEVFKSCDYDGKGLLDNEGLSKLCELLHLEDGKEELMACLLPHGPSSSVPSVSFAKFRDALLKLLDGIGGDPDKREPSPVREVSPKYVYGQKKYGRRSRPENTGEDSGSSESLFNGDINLLQNNSVNKMLSTSSLLTAKSDETNVEESIGSDLSKHIEVEPSGLIIIDKDSEVLCEAELRSAWERLGVGTGGYMHKNELAMVCSAVGMDTLADQVVSQVFSSLKTDEEGRISFEDFLEFFKSKIEEPTQTPHFVQYSKSPNIMDLCDFPHAGNRRLLHELQTLKCELEAVTEERDKLKSDLADADRRSTLLAQEIDERHARIEKTAALTVETLEQKHAEEIKLLKKQMTFEREQLIANSQRLEESLASHVEQLSKVWQDLSSLQKEYENLEKENQALTKKLNANDAIRREYQEQLECMEALHQRVLELECGNEKAEKLQDKINLLQTENTELRDKNDELTSQIELLICRNSKRREGSWSSFEYGGGTKRRGKSPVRFSDNRLGKVRRCCTETDLTLHSPGSLSLQKTEPSENGLEDDLSTIPATSLDNETDWELSSNSYDKIEGMKSYIAELEGKLEHYQLEDWLLMPNYKAEEKINETDLTEPSLTTADTSNASNISIQTISGEFTDKSESNSYLEVGVQTSGVHCHQVEGELELVRSKIVEILSEKKACSEEVCALKLRLESLMKGITRPNMDCIRCKASSISSRAEIDALKEENSTLLNRCSDLENSLELLRIEYEKTEDYWENKLDEERKLFELDKEQSDEKFAELEAKILEYDELIASDQATKKVLPPIEEKDFLEKQFTDLEEEYDAYRLATEEELALKENEISVLKGKLKLFESEHIEKKDEQCQTENPKCAVKPRVPSTSYKTSDFHKKTESCTCGAKSKIRDKLKAEVDALTHRKQLLMAQITSLQAQPHQLGARIGGVGGNLSVFQSLSNRLRQQELRCRELQSALRSQQKETETILQKAWERHKIDLTTIQNSLRVTQEKLQQQKKNTKQQLDRLAMADTLVKDLYAENAHLVATVVSLEHKFHSLSESALHNSF